MVFFFYNWWLPSEFLQVSDLVPKLRCRDKNMWKFTLIGKRIKCSGGRNERKFLKFIVGDGMSKQSKFLVLEICPELFVISLPSTAFCSLWQKMLLWSALLLQLPCINQKVMLLCFFSSLCCHHLAECLYPANDFSLSHSEFWQIFSHFHHHGT